MRTIAVIARKGGSAYRLTFQAAERTLTDREVDEAMDAIVSELAKVHGAVRR